MAESKGIITIGLEDEMTMTLTPRITVRSHRISMSTDKDDEKQISLDNSQFTISVSGELNKGALTGKKHSLPCYLLISLEYNTKKGENSVRKKIDSSVSLLAIMEIQPNNSFDLHLFENNSTSMKIHFVDNGIFGLYEDAMVSDVDFSSDLMIYLKVSIKLPFHPLNTIYNINDDYYLPPLLTVKCTPEKNKEDYHIGDKIKFSISTQIGFLFGYCLRLIIWDDITSGQGGASTYEEGEWLKRADQSDIMLLNPATPDTEIFLGFNKENNFYYPIADNLLNSRILKKEPAGTTLQEKTNKNLKFNYFSYIIQLVKSNTLNTETELSWPLFQKQDQYLVKYVNIPRLVEFCVASHTYCQSNDGSYKLKLKIVFSGFSEDLKTIPVYIHSFYKDESGALILPIQVRTLLKINSNYSVSGKIFANCHVLEYEMLLDKIERPVKMLFGTTLTRKNQEIQIDKFIINDAAHVDVLSVEKSISYSTTPGDYKTKKIMEHYFSCKNINDKMESYYEIGELKKINSEIQSVITLKKGWIGFCTNKLKVQFFQSVPGQLHPSTIIDRTFSLFNEFKNYSDEERERFRLYENIRKIIITVLNQPTGSDAIKKVTDGIGPNDTYNIKIIDNNIPGNFNSPVYSLSIKCHFVE